MNYVDFAVRADSAAGFWDAALAIGLAFIDEDGKPAEVRGANVSVLGPVQKRGVTPPEYWPNFHANIRIDTRVLPNFGVVLSQWMVGGMATAPHAGEFPVTLNGVELVENINSPSEVWA